MAGRGCGRGQQVRGVVGLGLVVGQGGKGEARLGERWPEGKGAQADCGWAGAGRDSGGASGLGSEAPRWATRVWEGWDTGTGMGRRREGRDPQGNSFPPCRTLRIRRPQGWSRSQCGAPGGSGPPTLGSSQSQESAPNPAELSPVSASRSPVGPSEPEHLPQPLSLHPQLRTFQPATEPPFPNRAQCPHPLSPQTVPFECARAPGTPLSPPAPETSQQLRLLRLRK